MSARPTHGPHELWLPTTRCTGSNCKRPQSCARAPTSTLVPTPRMGSVDWLRGRLQPLLRPPPRVALCSYNANGTPDPIIEGVWQTHPEVVDRDSWTTSELYEDPEHVLRRITPPPEALPDLGSIPVAHDIEQL